MSTRTKPKEPDARVMRAIDKALAGLELVDVVYIGMGIIHIALDGIADSSTDPAAARKIIIDTVIEDMNEHRVSK